MSPSGARTSAARAPAVRRPATERPLPARRPDLRVVDAPARSRRVVTPPTPQRRVVTPPTPQRRVVTPPTPQRRVVTPRRAVVLSVGIVVGSLLTIVVADDLVVTNQLNLSSLQTQLAAQSTEHQQLQLQIAQMETSSQIVDQAEARGMVSPGEVTDVPAVPLTTRLPEPKVAAPAAPSTGGAAVPAGTSGQ